MAWLAVGFIPPPYTSGYVLKFYQDGTSTPTNMATDNTGATQLASVAYDSNGTPSNGGSPFIPHIDQAFKMSLYPDQASADANSGAVWTIDNLSPPDLTDTDTDILATVSSNDTTAGYLNGKLVAGADIAFTENNDGGNETLTVALDSSEGTWTPTIQDNSFSDAEGQLYSSQVGHYTKIGRMVFISGLVDPTSLGTLSGALYIAGLPFTSANEVVGSIGGLNVYYGGGLVVTSGQSVDAMIVSNATYAALYLWDSAGGQTSLQNTELATGFLGFSGHYFV